MSGTLSGRGSLRSLGDVLAGLGVRRVFTVASPSALAGSYVRPILEEALRGRRAETFSGYGKGPDLREVVAGAERLKASGADCLLALGGGTPMDFAKLINVFAANPDPFAGIAGRLVPLVAVPTTCGTGSEATPFAVVYKDRIKHSLESAAFLLPDRAILDPDVLAELPKDQIACTGLDALGQSIESFWSVNSTEASRARSAEALALIREHLESAWRTRGPDHLAAMLEAAHASGQAIAVAKTTASHALSYPLTAFHGVPHGHAVALTLGRLLVHNAGATAEDCWDPRGVAHVRGVLADILRLLRVPDAAAGAAWLGGLMKFMGLKTRLSDLGVPGEAGVDFLIGNGINAQRLRNNPRALADADIKAILMAVL